MRVNILICFVISTIVLACNQQPKEEKLKVYGRSEISDSGDTTFHKIADYKFVDQDSAWVSPETFEGKIYVADFFFTSCPTICPIMKTQMLRVYEKYENNPEVMLLSHSIDPKHDTVAVLKEFADRLGVKSDKWHFITGEKDDIFKLGQTSYMVAATEDGSEPGGYVHSGAFILVDKERRIRGFYDGTLAEQVDKLMLDMDKLLMEYEK